MFSGMVLTRTKLQAFGEFIQTIMEKLRSGSEELRGMPVI